MDKEKQLLIVEDRFQITGSGLVLAPSLPLEWLQGKGNELPLQVRLELPDGTSKITESKLALQHLNPGGYSVICLLSDIQKDDVPIGTKVWITESK
jgi:hypothetical protein